MINSTKKSSITHQTRRPSTERAQCYQLTYNNVWETKNFGVNSQLKLNSESSGKLRTKLVFPSSVTRAHASLLKSIVWEEQAKSKWVRLKENIKSIIYRWTEPYLFKNSRMFLP